MDKLSYALGLSMAQNFKGSGISSINADDFADALRAVYEDKEKKMSYDEAKKVVQDFFTELEANAGAMNEELGKKFLEQNAQQEGVKVTESGLQYLILKEGNGVKPGPEDAVTVHYRLGRGSAAHERGRSLAIVHPLEPCLWSSWHRSNSAQQHSNL